MHKVIARFQIPEPHFVKFKLDFSITLVMRAELNKLNSETEKIDPNAIVVMSRMEDPKKSN